jgi:hypothetical protein
MARRRATARVDPALCISGSLFFGGFATGMSLRAMGPTKK